MLHGKPETGKSKTTPLTVAELAQYKGLPVDFLRKLGVCDFPGGGVGIPYYAEDGSDIAAKSRTALKAGEGTFWPKGQPLHTYGDWKLEEARKTSELNLVEGESDTWTFWFNGIPALGIPGANATKTLTREHLFGIETVYIHKEPDKGGETFVAGVEAQLKALGYLGDAIVWSCPDRIKDPSDLHRHNANAFKETIELSQSKGTYIIRRRGDAYDGPGILTAKTDAPANSNNIKDIWTPSPLSSSEFDQADFQQQFRIRRVLVADEPTIIFGAEKVLKTSTIVDMCISLASGLPFLGEFIVEKPVRTLFISGESGGASLRSIARRVCAARGIELASLGDMLHWECSIPPLWHPEGRLILADLIRKLGSEVCVVDPAYLTLLGGQFGADNAKNMFAMGELLSALTTACRDAGAQLLLIHHTNIGLRIGETPGLQHIAYAGFKQFARQWIGLNRMSEYEHDGHHELVMVAGGSAGHGGRWHLTVEEGMMDLDFSGRIWDVTVATTADAKEQRKAECKAEADRKKAEKNQADDQAVMTVIDQLGDQATLTKIRAMAGIGRDRPVAALTRLCTEKQIEIVPVNTRGGQGSLYRRME